MAMKAGSISALSLIPAQTDRPMSQSEEVPSARIVDMSLMQRLTLRDSGGEGRVSADDESTERREGLKRLDYRHLQVFEAVYVARNITRAGRSLGVSQPKMSTLLARLRDVLQDPLFVRRPRGVAPTPRADELIGAVRSALQAFDKITDPSPRFEPASATREFRLHMVDLFEPIVMPSLVEAALSGEGLSFQLLLAAKIPVTEALESGQADLAIGLPPPNRPELWWEMLTPTDFVVIARKGHPKVKPPFDPKLLQTIGHVGMDMTPNAMANSANLSMTRRLERRDVVKVSRVSSIIEIAALTDLVGIANRLHVEASPYRDRLQVLEVPTQINTQSFNMIWHTRSAEDEGVIWLREQVRAAVEASSDRAVAV